ncbi:hypothetical protein CR513_15025, partial [Mucuna pruriens]
ITITTIVRSCKGGKHVAQKFVGYSKQVVDIKKVGAKIMIYGLCVCYLFSINVKNSNLSMYDDLLIDGPKWSSKSREGFKKKTKNCASITYLPSSIPNTLKSFKYDLTPPSVCPMGQKAAKKKKTSKATKNLFLQQNFAGMHDTTKEKLTLMT